MYNTLNLSSKIRMVVSDFDGIFTDNSVFILSEDKKLKKLSFKDLMGVSLCVKNGILFAVISGEYSAEIDYIADKFGLVDIHQGIRDKLSVLEGIKQKYSLTDDEILYVGDDVNDIECLKSVKYAVTVSEANYKVKEIPHIQVTNAKAGDGAFREIIDNLLELKLAEQRKYEKQASKI